MHPICEARGTMINYPHPIKVSERTFGFIAPPLRKGQGEIRTRRIDFKPWQEAAIPISRIKKS